MAEPTHNEVMTAASHRLRAAWDVLRESGEEFDREDVFEQAFFASVRDLLVAANG